MPRPRIRRVSGLARDMAKAADVSPLGAQYIIDLLLAKMAAQKAPSPLRPMTPSILYVEDIWRLMLETFRKENGLDGHL